MEQYTRADSIQILLTGAGGADLSLGGAVNTEQAEGLGYFVEESIPAIQILRVSGVSGSGIGSIEQIDGNSLRYTAPFDEPGEAVEIADSETKLLESAQPDKFAVVTRKSSQELTGSFNISLMPIFNNVIGMSNFYNYQRITGTVKLRCIAIVNKNALTVENLKIWLGTLGTQQVSVAGQLGSSGGGVIETGGSFSDWPASGFCRVCDSLGELREIVYYSGRTDSQLTIPAAGRGLLDTVANEGEETDTLDAVPGMALALEEPVSEEFTELDDEFDEASVSGLDFETHISDSAAIEKESLEENQLVGLWLKLIIIEGASASPRMDNIIHYSFEVDEGEGLVKYTGTMQGSYRIEDITLDRYELYKGIDGEPDFTAEPFEVFGELPHETEALTETDCQVRLVLRKRNAYGLISQNISETIFNLDSEGQQSIPLPEGPMEVSISPATGGRGQVEARYLFETDDVWSANQWLIYFTDGGLDPDPEVDEPVVVDMLKLNGQAYLNWLSPAADNEDTLKVLVRTRRVDGEENYDSVNTDIYSATAQTEGPQAPQARAAAGRAMDMTNFSQRQPDYIVTGTLTPDASGNYYREGLHQDSPYYVHESGLWWLWHDNGEFWEISNQLGITDISWRSRTDAIEEFYDPYGDDAEGIAQVSAA